MPQTFDERIAEMAEEIREEILPHKVEKMRSRVAAGETIPLEDILGLCEALKKAYSPPGLKWRRPAAAASADL